MKREHIGEVTSSEEVARTLKRAIRSANQAKRGLAALPLNELVVIYWGTLSEAMRLADCQTTEDSEARTQVAAEEAEVVYDVSTEIVRAIDTFDVSAEGPYSAVLAEEAYRQYGDYMLKGSVRFDFSGYDQQIMSEREP